MSSNGTVVEVKRRMGEEDIAQVATLLRAAERVDHHAPLGEHKWLDLVHGGRAGFAGFVAREPGHERLVGYAQLSKGTESWAIEFVVLPSLRLRENSIEIELLRSALTEVALRGGGHVHLWVPKPDPAHDEIAKAVGLTRGRELLQMRRPLPLGDDLAGLPVAPTRPFEPGRDETAWLALNARAFADHPEQGAWQLSTLLDRENQAWFDPAGFLLHESEGVLDGFCWTKIHDEDEHDRDQQIGEIYVIGVDPSHQGRGLGKGLVLAGLASISARGVPAAMLYVDADNGPAVALYRGLGFVVDHHDLAYVGNVAPCEGARLDEPEAAGAHSHSHHHDPAAGDHLHAHVHDHVHDPTDDGGPR